MILVIIVILVILQETVDGVRAEIAETRASVRALKLADATAKAFDAV